MYRKGRQAIMGPFSTSFSRALNFCHAAPACERIGGHSHRTLGEQDEIVMWEVKPVCKQRPPQYFMVDIQALLTGINLWNFITAQNSVNCSSLGQRVWQQGVAIAFAKSLRTKIV